jgi:hypothetical protein
VLQFSFVTRGATIVIEGIDIPADPEVDDFFDLEEAGLDLGVFLFDVG